MEIEKIKIDIDKIRELRDLINNNEYIILKKNFKLKNNKKKNKEYNAIDVIYASLDRLNDTSIYLNGLKLNDKNNNSMNAFDFNNFINHSYILINCIINLAEIFEADILHIKSTKQFFNGRFKYKDYTDYQYFQYIRSICSVHPTLTDRHDKLAGFDFVCCPFVVWMDNSMQFDTNAQLCARVYIDKKIEDVYINIYEIYDYIYHIINFIDNITKKINEYSNIEKEKLINAKIKCKSEFSNYNDYIDNLKKEALIRYKNDNIAADLDLFKILINQKVSKKNKAKVKLYINAIKYSIDFLHKSLQYLDYEKLYEKKIKNNSNSGIKIITIDKRKYSGIKYPRENHYISLYSMLLLMSEHPEVDGISYAFEKCNYLLKNKVNSYIDRDIIYRVLKKYMDKYLYITGNETNKELYLLVNTTLYLYALENNTFLNRNIPNKLKFRERLLTDEEWNNLINYKNDIYIDEKINKSININIKFFEKYNINKK